MKKQVKIILVLALAALITVLVVVNRNSVKEQDELAKTKQLQIVVNEEKKVYNYSESSDAFTSFDTQMKRRNGEVTDKNYGGIQLKEILAESDIALNENTVVSAVCADQYEVEFTYSEVMEEGNLYLVTQENGTDLDEESGVFMLVVNHDEFSTRWAKNVVQVKIGEK